MASSWNIQYGGYTPFSNYENRENPDSESYALLKDVNAIFHVFSTFFIRISSFSAQNVFAKMHWLVLRNSAQ